MNHRPCKSCKYNRRIVNRGICRRCYDDPVIRARFGPKPMEATSEAFEPTLAQPGSKEKVRVLAARFAAGVDLHHPDDVKFERVTPGYTMADPLSPGFGTVERE